MRQLVVGALSTLLICVLIPTFGYADDDKEPGSDAFGVSPTGAIGPKAGLPKIPPPPAMPETGTVVPPAVPTPAPTFPGFFYEDEVQPVEDPTPPVDMPPAEEIVPPAEGEGPVEIIEIPYEDPGVVLPPPAPLPPQRAPRLQRRASPESCDPNCGQRRDDCCWPIDDCGKRYGRTTFTIEGSYGLLNDPEGVLGTPAFGFANQFEWDELDYDGAFGGRVTIEHAMNPQQWVQVRGAYYGSWDDSTSRVGVIGFQPGNTFTGGGTQRVGATNDVFGTISSEADFYGGEINYLDELSCSGCTRWDFLLGVRYLQFDEDARFDSTVAPITGFTGPAFVASNVENLFVGLQVGARWHYQPSDNFEISATMKVLGGNLNRRIEISDRSIFAGGVHAASSEEDEIVLGADIEIGVRLRLTRNIAVTAGYNMVFLDNVIRANDAMDFSASGSGAVQAAQNTDQVLWHGLFAGVSFNF